MVGNRVAHLHVLLLKHCSHRTRKHLLPVTHRTAFRGMGRGVPLNHKAASSTPRNLEGVAPRLGIWLLSMRLNNRPPILTILVVRHPLGSPPSLLRTRVPYRLTTPLVCHRATARNDRVLLWT